MDAIALAGADARGDVSTGIPAPMRAAPYDNAGPRTSYLTDERLSLRAKGLLTIITNSTYEQIVDLEQSDSEFSLSLAELRNCGYVGRFDEDLFEVSPFPLPGERHALPGERHGKE